jgi:dTDP-4-amino-4,6-dideoxygalactose transaminase
MNNSAIQEKISCLDLKGQHQQIKEEVFKAFEKVYENTAFSGGTFVEEFENNFANFCQTKYAIGVNNGTSALHLAMIALGIGKGDEVIVPANTFIATSWGVSYTGAKPVFVDCTSNTWQLDASKLEEKITPNTKAIIGVHLYGQPFDIDAVSLICKKNNLFLLEDAAQAHGAKYKNLRLEVLGKWPVSVFIQVRI